MMKKIILVVYCLFILLIVVLADRGALPLGVLGNVSHYDWIAHFLLYGVFFLLLSIVFKRKNLSGSLVLSIIILEEVSQLFISTRTFSFIDMFMGMGGVLIASFLQKRSEGYTREQHKSRPAVEDPSLL